MTVDTTIIGAWRPPKGTMRSIMDVMIVYTTKLGTAHAGDFRKSWSVPDEILKSTAVVQAFNARMDQSMSETPPTPAPAPPKGPTRLKLALANGALIRVPVWEEHYRGTNYLAIIDVDGTCPGGLSRRWVPRGKGACLYLVEQVGLFDALEFAADYTTSVGKKKRSRWYGFVIAKTDDELIVQQSKTGVDACIEAKKARVDPDDKIRAIEEEQEALRRKLAKFDEEITTLKNASP